MAVSPCPPPYTNPAAATWSCSVPMPDTAILSFHKTLPSYAPTPLVSLPSLAKSLGFRSLYVKDESLRFGLPSYKIVGASWAIYRAICCKLGLAPCITLDDLAGFARKSNINLVTCSDGNWGRAVSRIAKYLHISATILVPENIDEPTRSKISDEGGACIVSPGNYDAAIRAARKLADESEGALLVMDTSWEGYEDIPKWVTDGYSTVLEEVSSLIPHPSVVVVSVGVGSWAHSVVAHYKRRSAEPQAATRIVTVEPTVAASLLTSLHAGHIQSIHTGDTIMCGMNCGTTSDIAWPYLRDGVDAAVAVSDIEAHEAVVELKRQKDAKVVRLGDQSELAGAVLVTASIDAGPCGAAPLVALRKIIDGNMLGVSVGDADVILFCTEGARGYEVPKR